MEDGRKISFDEWWSSMEEDFWWKITFDGRHTLMENDLVGRRTSIECNHKWKKEVWKLSFAINYNFSFLMPSLTKLEQLYAVIWLSYTVFFLLLCICLIIIIFIIIICNISLFFSKFSKFNKINTHIDISPF